MLFSYIRHSKPTGVNGFACWYKYRYIGKHICRYIGGYRGYRGGCRVGGTGIKVSAELCLGAGIEDGCTVGVRVGDTIGSVQFHLIRIIPLCICNPTRP